jgi:Xaa-Pro aminopeptidase
VKTRTDERLASLRARMEETSTDLVAIGPTANLHYLLGFVPHADERTCLLLVDRHSARMVVPGLNREEIAAQTTIDLIAWDDTHGPREALRQALSALSAPRKLAVDGAMRASYLLQLQAIVQADQTVAVEELLTPLRICKAPEEIEALALAAAQADRAMQAAVDVCQIGATEAEVASAAEAAFRQDGAEEVCFTLIASGPNGAYPHHHSGERKLQSGDAIVLDIGASLNGLKSDITRMVYLGTPSDEFLKAYAAVYNANQSAMAVARPGLAAGDVDQAARAVLDGAGYGQSFIHRTGHGIGLEGHEPPWIMEGDRQILREGMVFSIEPGVYLVGQFGIRIEDIVVVTDSGVRNLTEFDHALVIKR